jgi:hypothetical protein
MRRLRAWFGRKVTTMSLRYMIWHLERENKKK